ncbi:unnamed protein product [Heligmosomoides polygyrus]|uniref:Reverse transcriptase n=1 Tax=Heligmosomoides polygyrus TaxID=6339 RepID=A0A183F2K7_HELPZ|nr:unnamed protein product [Heligmosomoides polygyrus]
MESVVTKNRNLQRMGTKLFVTWYDDAKQAIAISLRGAEKMVSMSFRDCMYWDDKVGVNVIIFDRIRRKLVKRKVILVDCCLEIVKTHRQMCSPVILQGRTVIFNYSYLHLPKVRSSLLPSGKCSLLSKDVINFITADVSASSPSSEPGKVGDIGGIAPPNNISYFRLLFLMKIETRSLLSASAQYICDLTYQSSGRTSLHF